MGLPLWGADHGSPNGLRQSQPGASTPPHRSTERRPNGASQSQPRATPWVPCGPRLWSPERATQWAARSARGQTGHLARPFRARLHAHSKPRALPWAGMGLPLRGAGSRRNRRPNGASQSQPRATPWVPCGPRLWSPEGATQWVARSARGQAGHLARPFRARLHVHSKPRALPWAGMGLPLRGADHGSPNGLRQSQPGASTPPHRSTDRRPNGASQSQPRATPWVPCGPRLWSPERATQCVARSARGQIGRLARPFRARFHVRSKPRALPWAGMGLPLRGADHGSPNGLRQSQSGASPPPHRSTDRRPNGASQSQPRATPWVRRRRNRRPNGATQSQPRATPWVPCGPRLWSPEGATQCVARSARGQTGHLVRPFRARLHVHSKPRALPWAGMGLPLRGAG